MSEPKKWKGTFQPNKRFLENYSEKEKATPTPVNEPKQQKEDSIKEEPVPVTKSTDAVEDRGDLIRLNKFIANAGVCSRRDADLLIANGEITVNGKVVTELGTKVYSNDEIRHKGKQLHREKFQYIVLNKPNNCVTSNEVSEQQDSVMQYVKDACVERIFPVGRLDRNTTGLLVFTNDGSLNKRLTHPNNGVKKIYIATLNRNINPEQLTQLCAGIELKDGLSKFEEAKYAKNDSFKEVMLVLSSGKNRMVRRLFAHLNFEVEKLDRVEFAGLKKGALNRGEWRKLSTKEVGFLKTQ